VHPSVQAFGLTSHPYVKLLLIGLAMRVLGAEIGTSLAEETHSPSSIDTKLINVAWKRVKRLDEAAAPSCKKRKLVTTRVTRKSDNMTVTVDSTGSLRIIGGDWIEAWTIDRCGASVIYDVNFAVSATGGTKLKVSLQSTDDGSTGNAN
jgi:hypothetical protein